MVDVHLLINSIGLHTCKDAFEAHHSGYNVCSYESFC